MSHVVAVAGVSRQTANVVAMTTGVDGTAAVARRRRCRS